MLKNIEEELDENFVFSIFGKLKNTSQAIEEGGGKILFIPTNIPLPFGGKRILKNIAESEQIKILSSPVTKNQFKEQVYQSIEYLLDKGEVGRVIFFCPRSLVDFYGEIPGSNFVEFKEIEIKDSRRTLQRVFERSTELNIQTSDISNNFSNFALRLFISYILSQKVSLEGVKGKVRKKEIYIPYTEIKNADKPLARYFLEKLGISDLEIYKTLSVSARKNIYSILFLNKYDFLDMETKKRYIDSVKNLKEPILNIFRNIAFEYIIKEERLFDSSLEELYNGDFNRKLVEEIQKSYRSLKDDYGKINTQNPKDAGKNLSRSFIFLFKDISSRDFEEYIRKARRQFFQDSRQIEEFSKERTKTEVNRFRNFLEKISEISLVKNNVMMNDLLSNEKWEEIFKSFTKFAEEVDEEEIFKFRNIKPLVKARREYERKIQESEKAEEIRNIEPSFTNLPNFLNEWCNFIWNSVSNEEQTRFLKQEMAEKYDEFCQYVVSKYEIVKKENKYTHISEILDTNDEKLRLYILIDGLGYTDFKYIQKTERLDINPQQANIAFSNIPTYTPSAISTFLTGLTAEETGIYGWQTKKDNKVFKLGEKSQNFEFIESHKEGKYSFELIQPKNFVESGITQFSKKLSNIRMRLLDFEVNTERRESTLGIVRNACIQAFEDIIEERKEIKNREEAPTEALKSDYVFYLHHFDTYLHEKISLEEFKNYYSAIADFLSRVIKGIEEKAEGLPEDVEIIVTGDHGKLTKHEREIIEEDMSYDFRKSMITDRIDLWKAATLNLDEADFTNQAGKRIIEVSPEIENISSEKIQSILEEFDEGTEEEIRDILKWQDFIVSGSKFVFGWSDNIPEEILVELEKISGTDTHKPQNSAIFDLPSIGLLSRYYVGATKKEHYGAHGGTSISEMVIPILRFGDVDA